jgi:putative phage-type endonuclease
MERNEWLEARRKGLGGSDIAAILGVSPWSTPMDVWLDKKGMLEDHDTGARLRGRIFEPAIANYFAEQNDLEVSPAGMVEGPRPYMFGSPDFWVNKPGEPDFWGLEIKTSRKTDGWGPENTDQIPVYYATQVHWYMIVTGKSKWDVMVYFVLRDEFRQYRLHEDKELHQSMMDKASEWWQKHIVEGERPRLDGGDGSKQLLNMTFPEDDGLARGPSDRELELFKELHSINSVLKDMKVRKEATVNLIKEQMGEACEVSNQFSKATWKLGSGRRTFDTKTFRKDHPDLADKYTKVSEPSRAFRFIYNEE